MRFGGFHRLQNTGTDCPSGVDSCSGDMKMYNYPALGDGLEQLVGTLGSPLGVHRDCMAQNSDHYAMWEIGVPAIVTVEHDWMHNPHFDQGGGDLYSKIDIDYHAEISRLVIAYTAKLAGL